MHALTPDARTKLSPVLNRPSLYRRLPIETVKCDPDLHVFLVRYPEVIVSIWQLMGVTKCTAQRTGQYSIHASDGEGTVSDVELVYGTPDLHVFYAEGSYDGPLFPSKLTGRSVLVLQTEYGVNQAGEPIVRNQLDVFVKLDNIAVDLVAKTLHPLIGRTADHNFLETNRFLSRISDAAATNSMGVQDMGARLENVSPQVIGQFGQIAEYVETREAMRLIRSGAQSVSSYSTQNRGAGESRTGSPYVQPSR